MMLWLVLACGISASAAAAAPDILVTSNADTGVGTLRWAVGISNTTTGAQTIGFSLANSITVFTQISVSAPVSINGGGSQVIGSTGTGAPRIFFLTAGGGGTTITGCAFINSSTPVDIQTNGNFVSLCRFGLDYTDAAHANTNGVRVLSASDNRIENCVFGNNSNNGILLYNATRASVLGCYVGSLASGTVCANGTGITLYQSNNCQVGGSLLNTSQRNVISGNATGIMVQESAANNIICGNIIGLNAAMSAAIPNTNGIHLATQAHNNLIGLAQANFGNVIAGNSAVGIYAYEALPGSQPRDNTIRNNLIGLNPSGTALPNGTGMHLYNADGFTIGGSSLAGAYEANVISGNSNTGLELAGNGNTISGNYIGTDAGGTLDRGNGGDGIFLESLLVGGSNTLTCRGNLIGGSKTSNRGNVISGNGANGITVQKGTNNEISGNLVGLAENSATLSNAGYGVYLDESAGNWIGRPEGDYGNIISGNQDSGIYFDIQCNGNTVCGNIIGLTRLQNSSIPNSTGIYLAGSNYNTIGLPTGTYGYNVIAGNTYGGIDLASSHNNRIQNNYIGVNSASAAYGNGDGVIIVGYGNLVGGNRLNNEGNVISGNVNNGVNIDGGGGNTVCGNIIGLSSDQTQARGNLDYGIKLGSVGGAHHNAVGLPLAGWGNVIGANDIGLYLDSADENVIQNNLLGVNGSDVSFPNLRFGIYMDGADHNLIGGPSAGNVITSSSISEIYLEDSFGNTLGSNIINLNAAGNSLLANYSESSAVGFLRSYGNLVGGEAENGNRICGRADGLNFYYSSGNTIVGNAFGLFANGQAAEASFTKAVVFSTNSHHNLLGTGAQGNQIAGGNLGVSGEAANANYNGFFRNLIYGQSTKAISLTNGSNFGIAAPSITSAIGQTITGMTQMVGDTVEVFQAEPAGNTYTSGGSLRYLGRVLATGSVSPAPWSLVASSVGGEYICATTSDVNNNTSEFSYNVLNTGPTATPTVTPIVTPTVTPTATPAITSTSTPVQIDWRGASVLAFPNPAKGQMTFAVRAPEAGKLTVAIHNLSGERIATLQETAAGGTALAVWNCSSVSPGIYLARVTLDNREIAKLKVAVLK